METRSGKSVAISIQELAAFTGTSHGLETLAETGEVYLIPYKVRHRPWPPGFSSYEQKRYTIENHRRHRILYVTEDVREHGCFPHAFRPYLLRFYDPWGHLVLTTERKDTAKLACWGTDIAGNDVHIVFRTTDELIGKVVQKCAPCLSTSFVVKNARGHAEFLIKGIVQGHFFHWPPPDYMDVDVKILDPRTKKEVDKFLLIRHKREPEKHDFGLIMPVEYDFKMKAVLLGTIINLYITYIEDGRLVENPEDKHWHFFYPARKGCTGYRICFFMTFIIIAVGLICGVTIIGLLYERGIL